MSAQKWDFAMLNGKNEMDVDQAILYNLVKMRKYLGFLYAVALFGVALATIAVILAIVGSN
jgi:hypothetical protein